MARKKGISSADRKLNIGGSFLLLFALLLAAVKFIDVKPVGPEGSEVGLAALNGAVHGLLGFHPVIYRVSSAAGILVLLMVPAFAALGLFQLVQRRSLFKVDADILALGGLYAVTALVYVLFEKVVINYRPVILDEGLEASFPSTHTMLAVVICGSAATEALYRIRDRKKREMTVDVLTILMLVTVIARLISGVHWLTDILAGLLMGLSLFFFYAAAMDALAESQKGRSGRKER